ncbi:MAG: hypothetical protein ACI9FG_001342 [Crocinitomicaceae bacterium]|jgi:hypothetical protein
MDNDRGGGRETKQLIHSLFQPTLDFLPVGKILAPHCKAASLKRRYEGVLNCARPGFGPMALAHWSSIDALVDLDFWREVAESPRGQDYHYNRNPETYLLIGDAVGRATPRLSSQTSAGKRWGCSGSPAP